MTVLDPFAGPDPVGAATRQALRVETTAPGPDDFQLPVLPPDEFAAFVAGRTPTFGEYMGANAAEGWWSSTLGATRLRADEASASAREPTPMAQNEWDNSEYWRRGLTWDERMTVGRARAMAETHDEIQRRQRLIQARDAGAFEAVAGFGAQMAGGLGDPVNFLPVAGPFARGARWAESLATPFTRAMQAAGNALERPGVVGGLTRGATEGAVGNAVVAPYIYSTQEHYGEEVTFSRVVTDLAIGGLIGGGFGAAFGRAGLGRMIQPDPVVATHILDSAARDVAAGRRIEVPEAMMRGEMDAAVLRAAPHEASVFLLPRDDGAGTITYRIDLPTRPDGAPLTREEFAAELTRRHEAERQAAQRQPETATETARDEVGAGRRPGAEQPRDMGLGPRPELRQPADAAIEHARVALEHQRLGEALNDAYAWYREALHVEQTKERLAAAVPPPDLEVGLGARAGAGAGEVGLGQRRVGAQPVAAAADVAAPVGKIAAPDATRATDAPARSSKASDADPQMAAARADIEAMRAEGRFTDADAAILRAGDEAAAQIDAMARGLTEAGACTLRTMI